MKKQLIIISLVSLVTAQLFPAFTGFTDMRKIALSNMKFPAISSLDANTAILAKKTALFGGAVGLGWFGIISGINLFKPFTERITMVTVTNGDIPTLNMVHKESVSQYSFYLKLQNHHLEQAKLLSSALKHSTELKEDRKNEIMDIIKTHRAHAESLDNDLKVMERNATKNLAKSVGSLCGVSVLAYLSYKS